MKANLAICVILVGSFGMAACRPVQAPVQTATAASSPVAPVLPSPIPPATETPMPPSKIEAVFPLAEPGPYLAGNTRIELVDDNRGGRKIAVTIWYPALEKKDDFGRLISRDAPPDLTAAPYPLILIEPNSGEFLMNQHLVSHGFVMAIVHFPTDYENWDLGVVDHPRDMVFALEQIAANPPVGLEGVIDTGKVGVTGYSWGGFYALALSGVRIDPEYYLAACEQAPDRVPPLDDWYLEYACGLAERWDAFTEHVGVEITAGDDGLWQPITDDRIRAVLPMAPDGAWLYGERGLAAADRPILLIAPAEDELVPNQIETKFIFEHLKTPDLALISFLGKRHMMVNEEEPAARMRHFAAAFFGYHLQGRQEYKQFFSQKFVDQFPDLAWGLASAE